jgi:anaerobic dimethyl sulfoxide reductase subunit C (anchor subunit)
MNNEGALIAFTLLSQMVIGSVIIYTLAFFFNMDDILQLSSGFSLKTPEFLLLLGLLLAILISLIHLGRPANAVNALNNLKTSWISREIFSVTLFSISLIILFIARWQDAGKTFLTVSFILSAIAGILLLVSMVLLYMIPTVSTWNNWLTPMNFILTALISGLVLMIVFAMAFNIELMRLKSILLVIMILLLFEIVHSGFLHSHLNELNYNHSNEFISEGIFKLFTIIRIAVIVPAILFLLFIAFRQKTEYTNTLLIASISLIFMEMILGRLIFFATFLRIGI